MSVRIVSPYLFLAEYRNRDGELVTDEAEDFRRWLEEHPDTTLEIVTNSVLTSDNFPAQSVIDMETAPRLLLDPDSFEPGEEERLRTALLAYCARDTWAMVKLLEMTVEREGIGDLLAQGDVDGAIENMGQADEALYYKALSQRALDQPEAALETLEAIVVGYPESEQLPRAWMAKA